MSVRVRHASAAAQRACASADEGKRRQGTWAPHLVVEAVDAVDRRALVVATQQEEVFGVLDLVSEQQADGLEALLASVDVVAEEEIVGFRRESAVLEEAQQVEVALRPSPRIQLNLR